MNNIEIKTSLPLDKDGFLRRECPNSACLKEFKWLPTEPQEGAPPTEVYYCPYCAQPSKPSSWLTQPQVEFFRNVAAKEAIKKFQDELGNASSLFSISAEGCSEPVPLTEPDDMHKVVPSCHPNEPLKVDESWSQDLHCLICGETF